MKRRALDMISLTGALASLAVAQLTITAEIVTSADDPTLPTGVLVIDMAVWTESGDRWSAGGFRVDAAGGLSLRYAADPNTGERKLTSPDAGLGGRHVTFVNIPGSQFGDARFRDPGGATILGAYDPHGPEPDATLLVMNAAYTAVPPRDGIVRGYTARAAFDIPDDPGNYAIVLSDPNDNTVGQFGRVELAASSSKHPFPMTIAAWRIIPEPATFLLVALGIAMRFRRR